jgi:hypothetical protein
MEAGYEPTLYDVIELMLGMEARLTREVTSNFKVLSGRIETLDKRLSATQRIVNKLVLRVEDVSDTLHALRDDHGRMLNRHEKRIMKLEKRFA